jgi:hypothetical protein
VVEPVPSVAELEHLGLAHRDVGGQKGSVARVHVSDAGHRKMGDAMRRNALEALGQKEQA